MDIEKHYTNEALNAVSNYLHLLPVGVQRKIKLAISVLNTHGMATCEELEEQLGDNWVIARRTSNIVQRYGKDVNCISSKQYDEAVLNAIESRVK